MAQSFSTPGKGKVLLSWTQSFWESPFIPSLLWSLWHGDSHKDFFGCFALLVWTRPISSALQFVFSHSSNWERLVSYHYNSASMLTFLMVSFSCEKCSNCIKGAFCPKVKGQFLHSFPIGTSRSVSQPSLLSVHRLWDITVQRNSWFKKIFLHA